MPLKLISVTELRVGNFAIIDNTPCIIKSMDISKTGKHGHAKVRLEAVGILDEKKRIIVMPGSERIHIPMVDKRKAQVLSINKESKKASIMDLESYETLEIPIATDILDDIKESMQIEYWDVEGEKIIKRLGSIV